MVWSLRWKSDCHSLPARINDPQRSSTTLHSEGEALHPRCLSVVDERPDDPTNLHCLESVLDPHLNTPMNPFPTSVLDMVKAGERNPSPSILELAYTTPSGIAQHVWDAHEKAKADMGRQRGQVEVEITFIPEVGAFEMVPKDIATLNLLRSLGPQAKITISI